MASNNQPTSQSEKQKLDSEEQIKDQSIFQPENVEFLDEDIIPPNWELAEKHGLARKIGKDINVETLLRLSQKKENCQCCGYQLQKEKISIWTSGLQLAFLGSGYPLFFEFFKHCIYILIVLFCITGCFNIITNDLEKHCISSNQYEILTNIYINNHPGASSIDALRELNKQNCLSVWQMKISMANKMFNNTNVKVQAILNIITVFAILIQLWIVRIKLTRLANKYDQCNVTEKNFSLVIKNVDTTDQTKDYFEEISTVYAAVKDKMGIKSLKKINLCYNLTELNKQIKEKNDLIKKLQKGLSKINSKKPWPKKLTPQQELETEISTRKKNIKKLEEEYENRQSKTFCGRALLTFSLQHEKEDFLKKFQLPFSQRFQQAKGTKLKDLESNPNYIVYGDKALNVVQAPEPKEVMWNNLTYQTKSKKMRRMLTFVITIPILGVNLGAILAINYGQVYLSKYKNQIFQQIISVAIAVVLVVVNIIVFMILAKLVDLEKHSTMAGALVSLAQKSGLALFFNIALNLFFVSLILNKNIIGKGGLFQNISVVFITNAIFSILGGLIYPPYLVGKILKWLQKRKGNKGVLTQGQANQLCELPFFNVSGFYAVILQNMFFCAFYAPYVPFCILLQIGYLTAYYWILKYNFLRKSSILLGLGSDLTIQMIGTLQLFVIIYAAANFIFYWLIIKDPVFNSTFALLSFFGLLASFTPSNIIYSKFVKKIIQIKTKGLQDSYDVYAEKFETNYEQQNPATKRFARWKQQQIQQNPNQQMFKNQQRRASDLKIGTNAQFDEDDRELLQQQQNQQLNTQI